MAVIDKGNQKTQPSLRLVRYQCHHCLYPCNTILVFAPILVSHNCTKTHKYYVNTFGEWKCKEFKLKYLVVSSRFSQMSFIYFAIVRLTATGLSDFVPRRGFFFLASHLLFGPFCRTCRRLLLVKYFSFRVPSKFLTN